MSLTKVSNSMIQGAPISVLDYGATGNGTTDDTAAIQAAINAAMANNSLTISVPAGTYKITAPLTYTKELYIVGNVGTAGPINQLTNFPVVFNCYAVTGYLFDMPDSSDGSGSLAISNLAFSGYNGATLSTTWQGLVQGATAAAKSVFYLRLYNVMVGGSNSATAILDIQGAVFFYIDNTYFLNWPLGLGFSTGYSNEDVATTITFNKCYWNSLRQVYEVYNNSSEITLNDCVIESCVVAGAALKTNVTFNNLYSENMGYDPSGTGITTGITPRNLGIAFIPAITGNVKAVHTCCYGQIVFNEYTLRATVGGMKWFDGIGRSSSLGAGGLITLNNLYQASGTAPLFQADTDTPSSKASFEYAATVGVSNTTFMLTADARLLSYGRVAIPWSDGAARPVTVSNGIFTLQGLFFNGVSALPTIYPDASGTLIGDVIEIKQSSLVKGARNSYVCTIAGTSGAKWNINSFIPSSTNATVLAAGTTTITGSIYDTPGELHVWEITGSTGSPLGANILSLYRLNVQAFSGAGQINVESLVVTNTLTFTMAWGSPYTITITNTSAVTVQLFARLISVSSGI